MAGLSAVYKLVHLDIIWFSSPSRLDTNWTVWRSNPDGSAFFSHPFRRALVLTQPPIQWVPGLFPGIKWLQRGVGHPSHITPRLKEECRYNYFPSGPSWHVLGWTFLTYYIRISGRKFKRGNFSTLFCWYCCTTIGLYRHCGAFVPARLLLTSDMLRELTVIWYFSRSATILLVLLGRRGGGGEKQIQETATSCVNLQLATGICPDPSESISLPETGNSVNASLMSSQLRRWRFSS